ncbi:MAG TPA: mechanosensitive ion channel family protein [Steroidobacteraceae bacterium]|nr:mechanosensitive ion channel family protein [Steroidobacteraceae bacterium]
MPLQPARVLAHVRQTVDWYRRTQDVERVADIAQDVVAHDQLQQAALAVVRQAFAFGRAAASLLPTSAQGAPPQTSLSAAVARINDRIGALKAQLAQIDSQLARSAGAARAALRKRRSDVNAALALEREVQATLAQLQRFQTTTLVAEARGPQDLLGQLEDLERSVPEARPAAGSGTGSGAVQPPGAPAAAAKSPGQAAAGAEFRPESAGIIALIGEWFSLESASRQLSGAATATSALAKELATVRAPLVSEARSLVNTDTSGLDTGNTAELDQARTSLQQAADRFRGLAVLLVPLGEQAFVLDDAAGALSAWRNSLDARLGTVERYLVMRLGVLIALIAVVLVFSEISRRATFRYLHDARRRSQFQTLRRVAVGIAIVLVLMFTLVAQLGSLATYAGFLTAGLAVALQNVILSVVAYFFLIGRYGVRVGDRITLAGVTGRVVDIGLIRLYIMELAGADLHSTGRIVVLSNSVLFQPQALFKQIPGADYLWHAVAVTLAATVDVQAVEQRLQATAQAVFEQYRGAIEAQHAAVQRLVDFETSMPRPEVRVGFAEKGLEFEVRYPVQGDRAVTIDQKMLHAVREAVAQEPTLPLAPSGEPALKRLDG